MCLVQNRYFSQNVLFNGLIKSTHFFKMTYLFYNDIYSKQRKNKGKNSFLIPQKFRYEKFAYWGDPKMIILSSF